MKRLGTHTQTKKSVRRRKSLYTNKCRYHVFWAGRRICNCH